jgi:2-iminobutanoate/2-iminopropanoate deaminase
LTKTAVRSPDGARAVGPYSPALRAGNLLLISGQIPLDPATGQIAAGTGITEQTRRALENMGALLAAAGLTFDHVVRTTVFLADLEDFAAMNEVYSRFFSEPYPARSTVQAGRLPRDARIEIDAIAMFDS